jgi:hypothetical protein
MSEVGLLSLVLCSIWVVYEPTKEACRDDKDGCSVLDDMLYESTTLVLVICKKVTIGADIKPINVLRLKLKIISKIIDFKT